MFGANIPDTTGHPMIDYSILQTFLYIFLTFLELWSTHYRVKDR